MGRFSAFSQSKRTLKQKLFGYMLLLALILLFALASGLFLFGHFNSTQEDTLQTLSFQMEVFEKDMASYWEDVAVMGVELSEDMTGILEDYFSEQGMSFDALTDARGAIADLQELMIIPVYQTLQKSNCSGAFVLLDATVNSALEGAEHSRSGVYLQKAGSGIVDTDILLYRGNADIGKRNGLMVHRKWLLEFQTDQFPQYEELISRAVPPVESAYRLTELITLPGTSDQAVLLTVPMIGDDGTVYGLCGFEVNKSYFKSFHAQPSNLNHLICFLAPSSSILDADTSLSCGITQGYYYEPSGTLEIGEMGGGLVTFSGDIDSYVGLVDTISLSANNEEFMMAAMIPKPDYDRAVLKSNLQSGLLLLLLLFFSVVCCLYFSRKFLSPILKGLEQLKSRQRGPASSSIAEIDDLFDFLQEQDRAHEDVLTALLQEKQDAQNEKEQLQSEYEKARKKYETAQAKITKLERSTGPEVSSEEYQHFVIGIRSLTPTERTIFEYYLAGKKVKEIIEITNIKESTLRYHNQNIYGKLGVHSLKQLLRYAALMQEEGGLVTS